MEITKTILAAIGAICILYVLVGIFLDITSFDQTKGGYEPPHEGWTGTPVDWDSMDKTSIGLVKRGRVIDIFINGTTGMMTFQVWGLKYDWQTPSDRALKVHKPREALKRRGFSPEF